METLDYLYDLVDKSQVTLIGYRFSDERIKDEIISNLGKTKIIDLSSSFSMKSILRDIKIEQVLNDEEKVKYLLLDINDIKTLFKDKNNFSEKDMSRAKVIESTIYPIRDGLSDDIKLIVTYPLNTTKSSIRPSGIDAFMGGSAPLYCSDLGLIITQKGDDKIIKIIKNRNGDSDKTIKYDSIKQKSKI